MAKVKTKNQRRPAKKTSSPQVATSVSNISSSSSEASLSPELRQYIEIFARTEVEKATNEKLPKYTEVLGVFVALFTFVSINIQIFTNIHTLADAILFSFLIFLCLVGFMIVMHTLLFTNIKELPYSFWAICAFIIFGIFILYFSKISLSDPKNKNEEAFEKRIIRLEENVKFLNK